MTILTPSFLCKNPSFSYTTSVGILCDACQGQILNQRVNENYNNCIFGQRHEEIPKLHGQSQVRTINREHTKNDRVGLMSWLHVAKKRSQEI